MKPPASRSASPEPIDQEIRSASTSDLGTCFFLEAGAGTGKTRILVERVLEIIRRGVAEIHQVVVITFTEKAAGELRARVRDRLHERLESAAEPERSRYRAALHGLVSAHIETVHAFASSLLREFPLEAGINPGFQQLDEVASRVDFQEQWDDWIWNVAGRHLTAVESCVRLGMSLDTVHEVAGILDRHRELQLSSGPSRRPSVEQFLQRMRDLRVAGDQLAAACSSDADRCLRSFHELRRQLVAVEQLAGTAPSGRRMVLAEAALHGVAFRPQPGNRRNWRSAHALERMRELQGDAREQLARFRTGLNDDALHRLSVALSAFVKNAAGERRRAGKLNFDDLLIEARALVARNEAVRAVLRDRFRFLLVDEFQDTDPLQAEMVFLLAADAPATATGSAPGSWHEVTLRPGKLFIVGDPKQSIYRFRRADIDTYLRAKEVFLRQPAGRARIATVSQNFRSVPQITDWVNTTFAAVLRPNPQFPGAQPEYRPIHAYRDAADEPRVALMYPATDLHETRLDELRQVEAAAVARLIADLIGNPRRQIGATEGGTRGIALRDICILVETRTAVDLYTGELARRGVPYIVDGGRDFFQHQEINDLAAILRAVDDPSDQVSLVAALKSAAFCCSDVDLLQHSLAHGRFSLLVREFPDTPVGTALKELACLYRAKSELTLPFLVDRAIRANFLAEPLLITSRERQRAANLRAIVDRAAEFAVNESDALRPFVRWLTSRQGESGGERDLHLAETDDDLVRVMTVHGAKGLEFPVVILAKLSAGVNHGAARSVVDRARGMIEFTVGKRDNRFSTPGFAAAAARETAYGHAEQARLLYVAATRARDLLVVSAFRSEERPGMFAHLPDLPSWVSVFDGGLREAAGGARGNARKRTPGTAPLGTAASDRLSRRLGRPLAAAEIAPRRTPGAGTGVHHPVAACRGSAQGAARDRTSRPQRPGAGSEPLRRCRPSARYGRRGRGGGIRGLVGGTPARLAGARGAVPLRARRRRGCRRLGAPPRCRTGISGAGRRGRPLRRQHHGQPHHGTGARRAPRAARVAPGLVRRRPRPLRGRLRGPGLRGSGRLGAGRLQDRRRARRGTGRRPPAAGALPAPGGRVSPRRHGYRHAGGRVRPVAGRRRHPPPTVSLTPSERVWVRARPDGRSACRAVEPPRGETAPRGVPAAQGWAGIAWQRSAKRTVLCEWRNRSFGRRLSLYCRRRRFTHRPDFMQRAARASD